jgi:signal transduction histidine kinase
VRRFLDATERFRAGTAVPAVPVTGRDEFAILGMHFNRMVDQITRFNEELRQRVTEATAERDRRLQEVISLNQQLFQVQGRLRHAERLAIVGRFMAQVAHELGTPLHSVAGHLELLRRDLAPAALAGEGGRRLGVVEGQLTRMSEIIAQLLDLTRAAPGPPAPVALNTLVAETVELIRPGISTKSLTVGLDLSPADPIVPGRAAQLQQVLLNLLTNAVDATAAGRIEIRTRWAGPQQVEVEVSDTGRGIPGEDLESLFDPFFTTKEAGRGVGLGLFIAAQLIREHGGTISVKSRLGEGTTFVVSLPGGGPAAR